MIYDRGCLRSGEEWVERNLIPVAGVTVAVSVLQVAGQPALWPVLHGDNLFCVFSGSVSCGTGSRQPFLVFLLRPKL